MAFNPFAGFEKYKRVWMGGVMILVMVTFVLCSGTKGDMGDILLRIFRFGGTPVVSIDGSTLYRQDFDKLIKQRKVANDYMRAYARLTIDAINERVRALGDSKDDNAQQLIRQLSTTRQLLDERTRSNKYFFETGTKADDIIDFQVWLAEADRLKINFSKDLLFAMIDTELYKRSLTDPQLLQQLEAAAMREVRQIHGYDMVSPDFVLRALENEYRVRIAQLTDAEYQLHSYRELQIPSYMKRIKLGVMPSVVKRTPLSPGQLWDFYQENRKEFDVALLPLPVAEFIESIGEPDPKKLQDLFDKYKKSPFDPESDAPGFKKPQQIRVQYVTADKTSPYFKSIANVFNALAAHPFAMFDPQTPLTSALTIAAGPSIFDAVLEQDYYVKLSREAVARNEYGTGSILLSDPAQPAAAFRARRNPIAVASMVGNALRPDGPLVAVPSLIAFAYVEKDDYLKNARKAQVRDLAPLYATAIASGTIPVGFVSFNQLQVMDRFGPPPLPLSVVRSDILKARDERLVEKFVANNLGLIKKKLEEDLVFGKGSQVQRLLDRYGPRKAGEPAREGDFRDLGLEIGQTEKFYDRYTIKDAPELKPLREAFDRYYKMVNGMEGRDIRPETVLKDDDFWKLFFDASEQYGASRGKYEAKPWPPVIKLGSPTQIEMFMKSGELEGKSQVARDVMLKAQARDGGKDTAFNLFATSDRPFLFWKTEEKPAEVPESLADVKDKVLKAWKLQQAREGQVLPYAKKLADSLLKGNSDYASVLKQDPKYGKDLITLDRLAPLYLDRQHFGAGKYSDYKLKRGTMNYPREDIVSQLLSLNDIQKPIKTDIPDLDRLNEDLFNEAKAKNLAGDRYVQILTNKPRDTFYVAVVQANRGANTNEFYLGVLPGAAQMQDLLFDRASEKIGEEHYRALKQQLRKDHRVTVYDAAKSLDNEGGS